MYTYMYTYTNTHNTFFTKRITHMLHVSKPTCNCVCNKPYLVYNNKDVFYCRDIFSIYMHYTL